MLKRYSNIDTVIQIRQRELISLKDLKDVCISGQFLQSKVLTDMPKSPRDGMKNIGMPLPNEFDEEYKKLITREYLLTKTLNELKQIKTTIPTLLSMLTPAENTVIRMYYFQGKSLDEISLVTNVSMQYVSKIKNIALKKMESLVA